MRPKKPEPHSSISADGAPYDGAARAKLHPNTPVLVSLYSIAAIAGIAFAGFCLVFNIVFRNRRWVLSIIASRDMQTLLLHLDSNGQYTMDFEMSPFKCSGDATPLFLESLFMVP